MEYVCVALSALCTLCVFTYEHYRRLLAHIRVMCGQCVIYLRMLRYASMYDLCVCSYNIAKQTLTHTYVAYVPMFVRPMKFFYLYVHCEL
jgi:hypothetical protein